MRRFNTAGPCDPQRDYMIPATRRLPEARALVEQHGYFVVHAPSQTGKTTTLRALARELVTEGDFAALYFSCESAKTFERDPGAMESNLVDVIVRAAALTLPEGLRPRSTEAALRSPVGRRLAVLLGDWAQACDRPIALFVDEVDAIRGDALHALLAQLRQGFPDRPRAFPASIALIGLRDVRDYRPASGADPDRIGTASPFKSFPTRSGPSAVPGCRPRPRREVAGILRVLKGFSTPGSAGRTGVRRRSWSHRPALALAGRPGLAKRGFRAEGLGQWPFRPAEGRPRPARRISGQARPRRRHARALRPPRGGTAVGDARLVRRGNLARRAHDSDHSSLKRARHAADS